LVWMPSPPFDLLDWGVIPVKNPFLGQQSTPFVFENHQGLSQSLLDERCIIKFAINLSKQQQELQPRPQQPFLSSWLLFSLYQLWWFNLLDCSIESRPPMQCRPRV
jgi:hypothetical protein